MKRSEMLEKITDLLCEFARDVEKGRCVRHHFNANEVLKLVEENGMLAPKEVKNPKWSYGFDDPEFISKWENEDDDT